MARDVTLLRFRFNNAIWKVYVPNSEIASKLGNAFKINRLFGEEGRQFGFINCQFSSGVVLGYFAHEGTKEIIDYDEDVKATTNAVNSYAHILFALDVETGIVALQTTKITGYVDLNLRDMRTRFPMAVEEIMKQVDIPVMKLTLQQDKTEITPDQLYQIFKNYKTKSMNIVNLANRRIPTYEEFKIFNPRVNEDLIYRQVFGEDTSNGLDNITLQSTPAGDLNGTAIAKLGAEVGDVKSITIDPQNNGNSVHLATTVSDRFKVPVSSDNERQIPTKDDVAKVAQPLTLTLTLQGSANDIGRMLNSIIELGKYSVEGDDEDDN